MPAVRGPHFAHGMPGTRGPQFFLPRACDVRGREDEATCNRPCTPRIGGGGGLATESAETGLVVS
eukprot:8318120-Lingulodinium_polyedra.AAC.1